MKRTKEQKGITLIALIITIVVLMILAAVAISSIKNDGIIAHAENAGNKYTAAQEIEKLSLAYQEYRLESYINNTLTFEEKLASEGWVTTESRTNYKVADLKSTIITIKDSNRTYRVLSNGNITEIDISWYNDTDTEFVLTTPAQLVGFEQLCNEGKFERSAGSVKTVKLGNNIDLSGIEWIPIGTLRRAEDLKSFSHVFDGNGYTISNLNTRSYEVNPFEDIPGYPEYSGGVAGLFGEIAGKIQNLTLKNVKVQSTHYAGSFAGHIGSANYQGQIVNCHVDGAMIISSAMPIPGGTYDNGDKAGGIAGYLVGGSSIIDCSIKNSTIKAYRDIGGIIGCGSSLNIGQFVVQNNKVLENVNIVVDNSHNYKNYTTNSQYNVNSIAGRLTADSNTGVKDNSGTATITLPY